MSIVHVSKLEKTFHVRRYHQGRWASLQNLVTRRSRLIRAVDGIDFTIEAGELVGYLGPNGAGKSTTIKMLTGLLVPSSGRLIVNGFVPWKDRRHYVARIGAVFGQRTTLWWDLPVIESFELHRHLYQIPTGRFKRNLAEFNDLLELAPFLDVPVRSLSLGQRMRADICAALLHDPELLFFDEPTIGLDVVAKERIRNFIRHINEERETTVLLTTHDIADVQRLCRRVMIIDRGKLIFDGELARLLERFGGHHRLIVDFAESYAEVAVIGAELLSYSDQRAIYRFDRRKITAPALIQAVSERYAIRDLSIEEPDIETTIRTIYEKRLL
ncbi:MAG: ATP-binding cassette domain-containing protein [Trueperaceae bacterium]|nr:MAG: ATP-binding cassette domain-containing protein [Trueperaceae bacterium]